MMMTFDQLCVKHNCDKGKLDLMLAGVTMVAWQSEKTSKPSSDSNSEGSQ